MAAPWQQISNQIQPYLIYPKGERLGASTSQGDPYFASGNWRLNRDEVMRFVARVERAVREVGATMLPLKIIDSPIDIEDFRDAKRGGAPEMAFRHPDVVKQVGDVVPLVFVRGMGGYAGSDSLAVREGGFGSVLGDVAIEALAGFSGETAGQVLTGFPLAAPHAQMGSVLHELTHYLYDEDHRPEGFEAITPFDKIMMNYEEYFPSSEFVEDKEPRISSSLTPITDKEGDGLEEKRDKESIDGTARSDVMALVDEFARQFERGSPYRSTDFWREAVQDGSISETETPRASVQVRGPNQGTTFWVFPGEVTNLRAQGFSIGPPVPRTQEEMLAEARRLNPNMDDPLGRNFMMADPDDVQLTKVAQPGAVTGGTVTVLNKQTGATHKVDQATAASMISMWPETWKIGEGASPPAGTPIGQAQQNAINKIIEQIDDDKEGFGNRDEVWVAFMAALGGYYEAAPYWKDFIDGPEYKRATAKWAEGFVSDKDQDLVDEWKGHIASGSWTPDEVIEKIKERGLSQPYRYDNVDWVISQIEALKTGDVTVTSKDEGQPGRISDTQKKVILDKWNNNEYTNIEQLVADIKNALGPNATRNEALPIYSEWQAAGLITGSSGIKDGDPGDPGDGVNVTPQELRPGEGRFTQFARAREVKPELGGPDVRQVRREFDPFERAYTLSSRFGSLFDKELRGIPTPEGYTAPTFASYLANRSGDLSLQGSRMGSLDILKELNALGIGGRQGMDIGFGDVYDPDTGDLLPGAEGKGLTRAEQNALIQDAAMAQYGTIGGGYVGGQLGRERDVFSARQAAGTTVQPAETANFFDYIRDKYGLSLGR